MEERRQINRVQYIAKSVIVVCDTEETIYVEVENVSPLGMGIRMKADAPDILGKDIIIVAETLIMYAEVNRQEKQEDLLLQLLHVLMHHQCVHRNSLLQ